jgi:hypothetical protein
MEKMGKYNEQLQRAGVLIALDGLTPPSTRHWRGGARLSSPVGRRSRCARFSAFGRVARAFDLAGITHQCPTDSFDEAKKME